MYSCFSPIFSDWASSTRPKELFCAKKPILKIFTLRRVFADCSPYSICVQRTHAFCRSSLQEVVPDCHPLALRKVHFHRRARYAIACLPVHHTLSELLPGGSSILRSRPPGIFCSIVVHRSYCQGHFFAHFQYLLATLFRLTTHRTCMLSFPYNLWLPCWPLLPLYSYYILYIMWEGAVSWRWFVACCWFGEKPGWLSCALFSMTGFWEDTLCWRWWWGIAIWCSIWRESNRCRSECVRASSWQDVGSVWGEWPRWCQCQRGTCPRCWVWWRRWWWRGGWRGCRRRHDHLSTEHCGECSYIAVSFCVVHLPCSHGLWLCLLGRGFVRIRRISHTN